MKNINLYGLIEKERLMKRSKHLKKLGIIGLMSTQILMSSCGVQNSQREESPKREQKYKKKNKVLKILALQKRKK